MSNGLECTAAQLRMTATSSQCALARLPLAGPSGRAPWIVELIGFAETADTADRVHALLPGEEAAVGSATALAAVNRAPPVRVVGPFVSMGRRQRQRRWNA